MNNLKKRIGKFYISQELIDECPDTVKLVLHDLVIVEATTKFHNRTIEYIAYSEHFDVVEEGQEIPLYMAIGSAEGIIEFQRIN